jgi:hypothetical protein
VQSIKLSYIQFRLVLELNVKFHVTCNSNYEQDNSTHVREKLGDFYLLFIGLLARSQYASGRS